jgi:hypothetical protein
MSDPISYYLLMWIKYQFEFWMEQPYSNHNKFYVYLIRNFVGHTVWVWIPVEKICFSSPFL